MRHYAYAIFHRSYNEEAIASSYLNAATALIIMAVSSGSCCSWPDIPCLIVQRPASTVYFTATDYRQMTRLSQHPINVDAIKYSPDPMAFQAANPSLRLAKM